MASWQYDGGWESQAGILYTLVVLVNHVLRNLLSEEGLT